MEFSRLTPTEIKSLSIREKIEYQKQINKERQRRYRENNCDKIKEYNRDYARQYREKNKDKCREMSRLRSKKYRDNMKHLKNELMVTDILDELIENL